MFVLHVRVIFARSPVIYSMEWECVFFRSFPAWGFVEISRLRSWYGERECRTFSQAFAGGRQCSTVCHHDLPRYRKAYSRSAILPAAGAFNPVETFEDWGNLIGGHALACVGD
jgi:hypothetical protein